MLCQREMSANRSPGEARGRMKGGLVVLVDEGSAGEEREDEQEEK